MGHRANLVVVDDDGWRLFYSHWAANGIHRWLAAGPAAAVAFVRAQAGCDPNDGWLDDVWCEGGAVVDRPARRLAWFGNDLMAELAPRRVFLRLLAHTWPGWRVDWAYDGIGDLAAHVGVDRAAVRSLDMDDLTAAVTAVDDLDDLLMPDDSDLPVADAAMYDLLTVRTADGLAAWVLQDRVPGHLAWLGPGLLDRVPGAGFGRLRLNAPPQSGLHVDARTRQMGAWTGSICPGLPPALDELWAGWRVNFWHDRYDNQLAAADGAIVVPPIDEAAGLQRVAESLAPQSWDRPGLLASFADLVVQDRAAGKTVEVNPAAWRHVETRPDDDDQAQLAQALAKLAAELGAERR